MSCKLTCQLALSPASVADQHLFCTDQALCSPLALFHSQPIRLSLCQGPWKQQAWFAALSPCFKSARLVRATDSRQEATPAVLSRDAGGFKLVLADLWPSPEGSLPHKAAAGCSACREQGWTQLLAASSLNVSPGSTALTTPGSWCVLPAAKVGLCIAQQYTKVRHAAGWCWVRLLVQPLYLSCHKALQTLAVRRQRVTPRSLPSLIHPLTRQRLASRHPARPRHFTTIAIMTGVAQKAASTILRASHNSFPPSSPLGWRR